MKNWCKATFLFLIFISLKNNLAAQDTIEYQSWTDFNIIYQLNNRTEILTDFGVRGLVSNYSWNQFYIRSMYRLGISRNFSIAAGVADFLTLEKEQPNTNEIRLNQDLNIVWPSFGFGDFTHRFRIEERFFQSSEGNDFNLRPRYMINFKTSGFRFLTKKSVWDFGINLENFFVFGKEVEERFANRSRLGFSLGLRPSLKFKINFNYILQGSREFSNQDFKTQENIFRLRLYYNLFRNDKTAPPTDE